MKPPLHFLPLQLQLIDTVQFILVPHLAMCGLVLYTITILAVSEWNFVLVEIRRE
jgi:hypothetical protein